MDDSIHKMVVMASSRVTSFLQHDSMQSETCKGQRKEAEIV